MIPYREMFWQVESVPLFYLLAVTAMVFFVAGIAAHIRVWKKSAGSMNSPSLRDVLNRAVLDTFLGRRLLQGDWAAGIMHLLIFWGFLFLFIGTCLLFIDNYIFSFLKGRAYIIYSFCLDLGGSMLIGGILWALVRRYIQRVPRLERRMKDALIPVWLLLAGLSGFMVEGLRLAAQQPAWAAWSFAGAWTASLFSPSSAEVLYPYLWWGHSLLSLGFIAAIPFTKLFHILGAPAAMCFQAVPKPIILDVEQGAAAFDLGDSIFFDSCMRCGRCVTACPSAGAGEPFSPRDLVQAMRRALWKDHFSWGDINILERNEQSKVDDKFWYCTTCRACLEVCPIYGAAFETALKQRILAVEDGTNVPKLMNQTLERVFKYDNPWESSKKNRGAWAEGLDLVDLTKRGAEADLCYFVGCTTSFDDTALGIARSFSKILRWAQIKFGILGKKEPCCGDIARRAGEVGLFVEQMEKTRDLFDQYGITEVVTSSPHCFHAFRNEYAEAPFNARHYTLLLWELINNGRLRLSERIDATVTFHDPCYLGRYNRIFDEPRHIIRSIPGVNLVEMAHHGAGSLCCGGGGGRMWLDLPGGRVKMSEVRIREAEATGAGILVTACPLCRIMLEDARKATGLNETLEVIDLNELVVKSLKEVSGDIVS